MAKKKQTRKKEQKAAKRKVRVKKQKQEEKRTASATNYLDQIDDAMSMAQAGKVDRAERELLKIEASHPDSPNIHYSLGIIHTLREEWKEAQDRFRIATDKAPNYLEAHHYKAVAHMKDMDAAGMLRSFQDVVRIGAPDDELVRNARQMLEDFEKSLKKNSNITVEEYLEGFDRFSEGHYRMKRGEYERAIACFQQAAERDPSAPQSFGNMGICHGALGQRQKAIEAFNAALERDPEYEPALMNKRMVEELEEGEKLDVPIVEIDYYKDTVKQNRK